MPRNIQNAFEMYHYSFKVIPVNWLHSGINQPNHKETEELDVKRVLLLQASMEKQKKNKRVKNIHKTVTWWAMRLKLGEDLLRE